MNEDMFFKFPKEPSEYDFSHHFETDVIEDGSRHMTWKKTFDTIRHGNIAEAEGNADAEWFKDYHGVKIYVLVGYNDSDDVPVVITGWPAVHDPRQAVESGRWTEQELRAIHQFNDGTSLEADFIWP